MINANKLKLDDGNDNNDISNGLTVFYLFYFTCILPNAATSNKQGHLCSPKWDLKKKVILAIVFSL